MDLDMYDFELLITQEIWGSELFSNSFPGTDPIHGRNETLPRPENGFQLADFVPSNQTIAALPHNFTWEALETAPAALQSEAVDTMFWGLGAHSTLDLAVISSELDSNAPEPPLERLLQSNSQSPSPAAPIASPVTTSQGFPSAVYPTTPQPPTATTPRTTPEMIDPGIPEVLVMPSSQSTSSESTSPVPQPPISTSEITSQSNDPAAPKMLPASIAKTCYSSQPQLLLMSRIEEIFDYQPVSAHGGKVPCATCARRSAPLVGALRNANRRESIPVITDHRLPIVIDDTDEETKDEDVLETRAAATAQCGNPKDGKPNESHERSLRKRVTAQHVKDRWDQPEYEEKLLRELRLAFYHHESCWMHIRELPEATSDAKVQLHDTNVQKFAQICRVNEAVSVEETQTLRKSCIDVIDHLLTVLSCGEDKDAVEELRRFVDEMQDHAMILSSIYAYRSDDDTQDEDYQPSKKRRL